MKQRIKDKIIHSNAIKSMERGAKKTVLPAFDGASLYDVSSFFFDALKNGAITLRAAAVTYNFFLAIFPSLIFLFNLIPYIPIENFQNQLLGQLEGFMPTGAYELTQETVEDLVQKPRSGLLSVGFFMALFFATNGFNSLITAFNQSSLISKKKTGFKQRLSSIALMFMLTGIMVIAISLIMFGQIGLGLLSEYQIIESTGNLIILHIINWVSVLMLVYFSISVLYNMGPSVRGKWKWFSAGSTLATFLIIVLSLGFAWYVDNFGQYNKLYGSIGTLIVIMLWMNFMSTIVLIGFELNVSIEGANKRTQTS